MSTDHSGYFYLIYENTLDINNFKTFINVLSQNEKKYLENILHIRKSST